jgi:hypothetical protein
VQLFLLGGELGLARLQLLRQQLRLLEQALGAHRRGDRVEHDADRFHQAGRGSSGAFRELAERGELDHRLDFVSNSAGRMLTLAGGRMAESRTDPHEIIGHILEQDRALVGAAWPTSPFAQLELGLSSARFCAP